MLCRNIVKKLICNKRNFHTTEHTLNSNFDNNEKIKVTVCGAAGKIGQLVALFLKRSQYNLNIGLYDISPSVFDLYRELKIVNTNNTVEVNAGSMRLRHALKNSDIVTILIKANNRNKTYLNENFELNYSAVSSIAKTCIEVCPQAILAIGTNPLNLMIPAICEIYKANDMPYRQKIIGLTPLDAMIARSIFSEAYNLDYHDVFVPITGGTSVSTIIPIFSQATPMPNVEFYRENTENLVKRFLEYKIVESNMHLSSALAIYQFIKSLIKALTGEKDVAECAFVATDINLPSKYLISLIDLDECGIVDVYGPPKEVNYKEKKLMNSCLSNLYNDLLIVEKKKLQEGRIET